MAFLNNKQVGIRLLEERVKTKLSARRYAMDAGVDQSQYSKIEKGELTITENILQKLVSTYGMDKNYILYGKNVPHGTFHAELNEPEPKIKSRIESKLDDYGALLSVIVSELAAIQSSISGENAAVLTKKIYKAAEELRKIGG